MSALRKLLAVTAITTFLLILVGASVRASGAGLGCPDWPKCFGQWIPPSSADALPPEFDRAAFNARKTWTEYLNRLLGATVGILVLASMIASWRGVRRGEVPRIVGIDATAAFLLTGFEAWLGGIVVKKGLDPRLVTVHLVGAFLIIGVLLHAWLIASGRLRPRGERLAAPPFLRSAWIGLLVLVSIQVVVGALVRGGIDAVASERPMLARGDRLAEVGYSDWLHRKLALLTAVSAIALAWWSKTQGLWQSALFRRGAQIAGITLTAQLVAGLVLAYFGLPAVIQVAHIGLSTALWCALLTVVLSLRSDSASA